MTNTIESEITKLQVSLLNMDENIFRAIFQYLEFWFIYFELRFVCRKFYAYVKSYIQLEPEKLFLRYSPYSNRSNRLLRQSVALESEYLLVLKHSSGTVVSICSKQAPVICNPSTDYNVEKIRGNCCEKCFFEVTFVTRMMRWIIFGYYFAVCSNCKHNNPSNIPLNTNVGLDELITTMECFGGHFGNHPMELRPMQQSGKITRYNYNDTGLIECICNLDDSILVLMAGEFKHTMVHITFNIKEVSKNMCKRSDKKTDQELEETESVKQCALTYSAKDVPVVFEEGQEHIGLYGCSFLRLNDHKVMIIGGFNELNIANLKLWEAIITDGIESLQFKAVDIKPLKARRHPICFKLRNNLYIAGGKDPRHEKNCIDCYPSVDHPPSRYLLNHVCCDRYNIKERVYYGTDYRLPVLYSGFSRIATDQNETFAIIKIISHPYWTKESDSIYLVFSESCGFKEMPYASNPYWKTRFYQ